MPIKKCRKNGKRGWKYGSRGKCYTGKAGKRKANRQRAAILASGYVENQAPNPLKKDPSRTKTLRDAFARSLRVRFNRLKQLIIELVEEEDAFGLKENPPQVDFTKGTRNDGRRHASREGSVFETDSQAGLWNSAEAYPSETSLLEGRLSFPVSTLNVEYASTQINVDNPEVYARIGRVQYLLDPRDVLELEHEPHVTVLYGLTTEDPQRVRKIADQTGLVRFKLGRLSLFSSEKQDVLKLDVTGESLHQLNRQLRLLPHDQLHPEYVPHLTVAYLSPGTGWKYVDLLTGLEGKEFAVKTLTFSDRERIKTKISLTGGSHGVLASDGDDDRISGEHRLQAMLSNSHGSGDVLELGHGLGVGNSVSVLTAQAPGLNINQFVVYSTQNQFPPSISYEPLQNTTTTLNNRFRFQTNPQKVQSFVEWLRSQMSVIITGGMTTQQIEDAYWTQYIYQGYQRGAARAFDNAKKPYAKGYAADESTKDFFAGSKYEFLRQSFAQPVAKEKVQLLAGRVFTELNGVTEDMATKLTRSLTDGLVQGQNPRVIARQMANDIDGINKKRAEAIAQTEMMRAFNEGALDGLENLGVEDVGVAVEWETSGLGITARGNPSPCSLCKPMEGVVLKLSEAKGMLPRHPYCRCTWIPANVGESTEQQLRTQSRIRKAISQSLQAEIPNKSKRSVDTQRKLSSWTGAGKSIGKKRPKGIV